MWNFTLTCTSYSDLFETVNIEIYFLILVIYELNFWLKYHLYFKKRSYLKIIMNPRNDYCFVIFKLCRILGNILL